MSIFIVGVACLGGWAVWQMVRSLKAGKADNLTSSEAAGRKRAQVRNRLEELSAAMSLFDATQASLRMNAERFCDLVGQFEAAGLKRVPLAPAPPLDRKGAQGVVRYASDKAKTMGLQSDPELLPEHLRRLVGQLPPAPKHWLARRVRSGEVEILSRSAAYFQ